MSEPTINSVAAQQQAIATAAQEAKRLTVKTAQLRTVVELRSLVEKALAETKAKRDALKQRTRDLKDLLEMSDKLADGPELCPCDLEGMIVDFRQVLAGRPLDEVAAERVEAVENNNLCSETPFVTIKNRGAVAPVFFDFSGIRAVGDEFGAKLKAKAPPYA